jgi:hypothetical protein
MRFGWLDKDLNAPTHAGGASAAVSRKSLAFLRSNKRAVAEGDLLD